MQTTSRESLAGPGPNRGGRARLVRVFFGVSLGVYFADQVSKVLAVNYLVPGQSRELVGELLRLQLIRNPGAALSIATDVTWVLTMVAVVVVVMVIRASRRVGSLPWAIVLGLLMGGALGNLTDRLLRTPGFGRGYVVDFLAYGELFIGNIADIAIVLAAVLVLLLTLRGTSLDGRRGD